MAHSPHFQTNGSATAIEDTIYLRNLRLSTVVGVDAWGRPGKAQPVIICIQLHMNTSQTGSSDDLQYSFSYGQMCKDVTSAIDHVSFEDIDQLSIGLAKAAHSWPGETMTGQVMLPKAFLRVDGGFSNQFDLVKQSPGHWKFLDHRWIVNGIKAACIIGVNAHERLEKQTVNIDLTILLNGSGLESDQGFTPFFQTERWQALIKEVLKVAIALSPSP